MKGFFIISLSLGNFISLQCNAFIREQHKVVDQSLGSLCQGIFRMNGTISADLENQFFIIGLLLNTEVFDAVFYILYGSVNRIGVNSSQRRVGFLVLFSRNIPSTLFNGNFHGKVYLFIHITDHQLRVKDLESGDKLLEMPSSKLFLSCYRDSH